MSVRKLARHHDARPVGHLGLGDDVVTAIQRRIRAYLCVTVMVDAGDGGAAYVFGPNDQKASLFELRHPEWLVGTYTRAADAKRIEVDLKEHMALAGRRPATGVQRVTHAVPPR